MWLVNKIEFLHAYILFSAALISDLISYLKKRKENKKPKKLIPSLLWHIICSNSTKKPTQLQNMFEIIFQSRNTENQTEKKGRRTTGSATYNLFQRQQHAHLTP